MQEIKKVAKGEIWLAYDARSQKHRPFIIMSNKLAGIDIDIHVNPTTTQPKRNQFDLDIEEWEEAGLDMPSVARCSKLHYIPHQRLKRKIGNLTGHDMERINQATREYFDL